MMSNQHDDEPRDLAESRGTTKICRPYMTDRQMAIVAFAAIIAYNAVLTAAWLFGLLNW